VIQLSRHGRRASSINSLETRTGPPLCELNVGFQVQRRSGWVADIGRFADRLLYGSKPSQLHSVGYA
jgi:hypothetical protein